MSPLGEPTAGPGRQRDAAARVTLVLLAMGAVVAFVGGVSAIQDAGDSTRWVESWRAIGFLTFGGLFALLALRPRGVPGVWEILFANKAALALIALVEPHADERSAGLIDAVLAALIVVAYALARGWTAWARKPAGERLWSPGMPTSGAKP